MNNLWTKLKIPKIKVIEIGAAQISDHHPCDNLFEQGGVDYIGFEPNEKECAKLNISLRHKYLPYFIGDGSAETFYECEFSASSSIYEPNIPLLSKFQGLAEAHAVKNTRQVFTHCLDGIEDCKDADFLKMDCQGAELKVLRGAEEVLESVTVVQTEAMFLEMYLFQPLFGEIDWFLRKHGFVLHKFLGGPKMCGTPFKPAQNTKEPHRPISQAIWADVVYVKDFMGFDEIEQIKLLKTAAILNDVYNSQDLVHYALSCYPGDWADNYAAWIGK